MKKRPNIVFFFSDQQRWDTLKNDVTPTLFEMAKEGVNFTKAYTCQPVCGPARACLQTGVYATQNGCYVNAIPLKTGEKTLGNIFSENGYDTAYIGKWHLASGRFPGELHCEKTAVPKEKQGGYRYWRAADVLEFTSNGYGGYVFDENGKKLDFEGIRADKITDFALDYLSQREKDKPFFMFLSHIEPHHQNSSGKFECPVGSAKKYENEEIPNDLNFLTGNYVDNYADYLACCERLDYNLDRIIKELKRQGIYEDTVIIYTSDHGCHFKTRNMEYKRSCHESSTHIPCVIKGINFIGGKEYNSLVSLIDYPPTLLDIAGIEIPKEYMGHSLISMINGDITRDCVFMQISETQCGRAIRTDKYKYAVRSLSFGYVGGMTKKSSKIYFEDYLYDLEKDPYEKNNLIKNKSYNDVRADLRKMLVDEMVKAGESKPCIFSAVIVRKK